MSKQAIGLRQKLRYRFDNWMAKGAGAQIMLLALISVVLVVITATVVVATGVAPEGENGERAGFGTLAWGSLMRTLDAGNMADDGGSYVFMAMMLFITMGGIFVLSALIGILNGAIEGVIANLRKGKSLVVESGHTVILGYTEKIHTLISELAAANSNKPDACVVVMSEKDKTEMDDDIRQRLDGKRLKVVTRSGNPLAMHDLAILNLAAAKSIVIISPEQHASGEAMAPNEADTVVLKSLLAVQKGLGDAKVRPNLVAELQDERTLAVARMVVGDDAALILAPPLISRLLVQTGRQSGLSVIYTELLDFGGDEIYIQPEPRLVGSNFYGALFAFEDSALMGIIDAQGKLMLPPAMDYVIQQGDQIIAMSEDDDTLVPNGKGNATVVQHAITQNAAPTMMGAERTLVLGTSERLGLVLRELGAYVAPGSDTVVVGENPEASQVLADLQRQNPRMRLAFREGDITDRGLLDQLDVSQFDHVMVLSEQGGRTQEFADARTLITLLHLRDIDQKSGRDVPVTTEMLDIQNRELAQVAEADDFIISNTLVSLLMAQVSENKHLIKVFDDLFSPEGYEIYLKPATDYVLPEQEVDFYTIIDSAARQRQVALGYRIGAQSKNPEAAYGVKTNPKKSDRVRLGADDKVIVLAEN
jgi:hypothetical protein